MSECINTIENEWGPNEKSDELLSLYHDMFPDESIREYVMIISASSLHSTSKPLKINWSQDRIPVQDHKYMKTLNND